MCAYLYMIWKSVSECWSKLLTHKLVTYILMILPVYMNIRIHHIWQGCLYITITARVTRKFEYKSNQSQNSERPHPSDRLYAWRGHLARSHWIVCRLRHRRSFHSYSAHLTLVVNLHSLLISVMYLKALYSPPPFLLYTAFFWLGDLQEFTCMIMLMTPTNWRNYTCLQSNNELITSSHTQGEQDIPLSFWGFHMVVYSKNPDKINNYLSVSARACSQKRLCQMDDHGPLFQYSHGKDLKVYSNQDASEYPSLINLSR